MESRHRLAETVRAQLFSILAGNVRDELNKVYFRYQQDHYSLITTKLAQMIFEDIVAILSSVDYSDSQNDIINDLVQSWLDEQSLPICENLTGRFVVMGSKINIMYSKGFEVSGWCDIYFNSLDYYFPYFDRDVTVMRANHGSARSATTNAIVGDYDERKKSILLSFCKMLASVADDVHLQQLKAESADHQSSMMKALRKTRGIIQGLFSSESDTRSYSAYIRHLDALLAKIEATDQIEHKM